MYVLTFVVLLLPACLPVSLQELASIVPPSIKTIDTAALIQEVREHLNSLSALLFTKVAVGRECAPLKSSSDYLKQTASPASKPGGFPFRLLFWLPALGSSLWCCPCW